jgi:hypothetical protein
MSLVQSLTTVTSTARLTTGFVHDTKFWDIVSNVDVTSNGVVESDQAGTCLRATDDWDSTQKTMTYSTQLPAPGAAGPVHDGRSRT